jgi:hypothetical protein
MSRKPKPDYGDAPKQKTPKGLEIPVPKREDVMADLRKVTKPIKK